VAAQAALIREGGEESDVSQRGADVRTELRVAAVKARRQRLRQQQTVARPSTWLSCPQPVAGPCNRLICFPHAGGAASFFRAWGTQLPEIEVHAVCYPGRAARIHESPASDLRTLAGDIAGAIASLEGVDGAPLALFGHSMGAVVALETARTLEARGIAIAHLLVSGSRNGDRVDVEAPAASHDEHADAMVERLVELGGTDAEMAADPLFQELVLPYVRSDSQMFHAYMLRKTPRLTCPVTAIVGDVDVDADLRPWAELTSSTFREYVVSGDHFYLVGSPPCDLILRTLGGERS
jgi:surfactin synthase thioesterase subunit